jgi:predicted metal-dependent hydrolase
MLDTSIIIDDISFDIQRKTIKHLHLKIIPPQGLVKISAPKRMNFYTIRRFIEARLPWIREKRNHMIKKYQTISFDLKQGDDIALWGNSYPLVIGENSKFSQIYRDNDNITMRLKAIESQDEKIALLEKLYRQEIKGKVLDYIGYWELKLGVKLTKFVVQKMKTRWGSCSIGTAVIRLNLELARFHPECLNYIVLHELAHLKIPSHNAQFKAILDYHMPHWRLVQKSLKGSPQLFV